MAPHDIAETDRRASLWRKIHRCLIPVLVDHWQRRVYSFEVDLRSSRLSVHVMIGGFRPYNSSTASCVGMGSSSPRSIISQEKL